MIRVSLPLGKKTIYYFDTEQSHFDVFKVLKRVLKDSSAEAKANFEAFGLRTLPPKDRLFLIEQKIYDTDSLGIVVIDGVRDLVSDINSPEEATFVSSKLLKWSQEIHIHIVVVLHQNKADNNARGHLGTEIVNKAESVISVEKDNEVSLVKPVFLRGKDFEPFGFSIDAAGMPYFLEDYSDKKESKKAKLTAFDIPTATHFKVLDEMFFDLGVDGLKYKDLETNLKVKFQQNNIILTNTQVVDFISYYRQNEYLRDSGGKGRSGNLYSLNKSFQG